MSMTVLIEMKRRIAEAEAALADLQARVAALEAAKKLTLPPKKAGNGQ